MCVHSNEQFIILPVVLHGCETWSLTLSEECMVFENRILRRIFGPKMDMNGGVENAPQRGAS